MIKNISNYLLNKYNDIEIYPLSTNDIIFEDRVQLKCFYCSKYNIKWTCPPKIPKVDYKNIIQNEYTNACIICYTLPIQKETFEIIRAKTTNMLHTILLDAEKYFYKHNDSLAMSFIGGSCKLCKNGCNVEHCNNPTLARIPMEAAGINVIKTMEKLNIDVKFPINDKLSRYGLLLWEVNS